MKNISFRNPIQGAVIVTIFAVILFSVGIYFHISWLEKSIPAFFSAVATLLVGLYAFTLYRRQKEDIKKDAANIILLEIQNAEKVLKLAQRSLEKDPPDLPYDLMAMPTGSWEKNKYLFVADFDGNQWEAISNFYSACNLFDEAVKTNASYFQKNEEQIRVNIQARSAELTRNYSSKIDKATILESKTKLRIELRAKVNEATDLYLAAVSEYRPQKPINDAKLCVEIMKLNISLPIAINKLKELAK